MQSKSKAAVKFSNKFFIGTSGWQYKSWRGDFYPRELPVKSWLAYCAENFNSIEVNSSFYHLPKPEVLRSWAATVLPINSRFQFALKLYMRFTRFKKLLLEKDDLRLLGDFLKSARELGPALGPILVQLPPNLKFDPDRLKNFLQAANKIAARLTGPARLGSGRLAAPKKRKNRFRFAIEFRHSSWLQPKTYKILKQAQAAFAISDAPRWPTVMLKTADFVYIRFHGKPQMFASPYGRTALKKWAKKILALKPGKVYGYFNNDAWGHAPHDALTLAKLL